MSWLVIDRRDGRQSETSERRRIGVLEGERVTHTIKGRIFGRHRGITDVPLRFTEWKPDQ